MLELQEFLPHLTRQFKQQQHLLNCLNDEYLKKFTEKDDIGFFTLDDILKQPKQFRSVFYNSICKHQDVIRNA